MGDWSKSLMITLWPEVPLCCPADKPLTGMRLLAVGKLGKNKDELKAAVEELGGKITGSVSKASVCVSTKSEYLPSQGSFIEATQ